MSSPETSADDLGVALLQRFVEGARAGEWKVVALGAARAYMRAIDETALQRELGTEGELIVLVAERPRP